MASQEVTRGNVHSKRKMDELSTEECSNSTFYCDIYGKLHKRAEEVVNRRRMTNAPHYAEVEDIKRKLCVTFTTHKVAHVQSTSDIERAAVFLARTSPAIGRLLSEHHFCHQ